MGGCRPQLHLAVPGTSEASFKLREELPHFTYVPKGSNILFPALDCQLAISKGEEEGTNALLEATGSLSYQQLSSMITHWSQGNMVCNDEDGTPVLVSYSHP